MQFGVHGIQAFGIARTHTECCAQGCGAVTRNTNEACLLVERAANGLADPERCVGGELETTAPVKLVYGVLETQVALLNEVEQVHALWQWVTTSDGDHQSEVRANEVIFCLGSRTKVGAKGSTALASLKLFGGIAAFFDGL